MNIGIRIAAIGRLYYNSGMKVSVIKTHKITHQDTDILAILDTYIPVLQEETVVAVTSKIVSICEGRIVNDSEAGGKEKLIAKEAEYFLPSQESKYDVSLTIKNGLLIATAGIDESNIDGDYVLWPKYPQASANKIREHLAKKFSLKNLGIIITDSKTTPLRWGTTGVAIAHSGFAALHDYRGKPDLFGRKMKMTQANIMDALAVATVAVMGEGNEQTPLALIEDLSFVTFQPRNPTKKELKNLRIDMKDDLYAPLLRNVEWKKGKL
ncbi:coenzyme F420-0:L-glutamate ligase [Patescibacteria group bacterium]|nr:coenzyme F420-0:L-glutamate ligase [Patescibacteria group bacterium]